MTEFYTKEEAERVLAPQLKELTSMVEALGRIEISLEDGTLKTKFYPQGGNGYISFREISLDTLRTGASLTISPVKLPVTLV